MPTPTQYETLVNKWENAKAFLINGAVCSDFSLGCTNGDDDDTMLSFYIYGSRGLSAEYFVDRDEIDNGELIDGGVAIDYCGKRMEIVALSPMK